MNLEFEVMNNNFNHNKIIVKIINAISGLAVQVLRLTFTGFPDFSSLALLPAIALRDAWDALLNVLGARHKFKVQGTRYKA